jgi:glutathione reductase (NADPH)
MDDLDFDLLVIGAGSGGVRAARMAAAAGARVAVADPGPLGGTCVNAGCVPKKLLVYAAQLGDGFDDAAGFGWTTTGRSFDWSRLIANKDREIARLNGIYARLLGDAGVTLLRARATVTGPREVEVDGRRLSVERILLATGGRPQRLGIPGDELAITSDEAFHLAELPRRVLIAGGGYIAVEFAGIFRALGSEVTLMYRGPLFLRGFDDDIRRQLAVEMRHRGIDLRFERCPAEIRRTEADLEIVDTHGELHWADQVLLAVGRRPNTRNLGLEEIGVELDVRGAVVVDRHSRTRVRSIWAIGDVTDRLNLTPVAIAEAMAFVATELGGTPRSVDYDTVPTAVFSQPSVAAVGLTEEVARQRHGDDVVIFRSSFRPMKHTLTGRNERSLMKLIVQRSTDRLLGVHVLGPEAGEIVQGFAVALTAGLTKAQLDATIGIHPTAAEELVTMRTPVG